ncbi:hypothetical protein H2200_013387 [Cladophialophora chaetospira]|uniref:Uncharacterized protein n=1 Tax=Cladophialophora chaetospira TaxID=386627 RepID=A0AA38UDW0_9EURO|nr:hypothetical protein H2200_013387 [Cladophialophora chaetospira]
MVHYGVVNSSQVSYTGPYFNNTPYQHNIGATVEGLKRACRDHYGPGELTWIHQVVDCVLNNLSAQEQANANQHTYFLTLWPAFISIIVAMGPDAADIAYDNLAWAFICALTSAAMPGFQKTGLPHHFVTASKSEARHKCESMEEDSHVIKTCPRSSNVTSRTGPSEWLHGCMLLLCIGLHVIFVTWYLRTLHDAFNMGGSQPWWLVITWYMLGSAPAIASSFETAILNSVELYLPVKVPQTLPQAADPSIELAQRSPPNTKASAQASLTNKQLQAQHPYVLCKHRTGFHTWWHILKLQISAQPYRILVRPTPSNYLLAIYEYCVFVSRFVVFAFGSMSQGDILFLSTPTDFYLTVLLVFATTTPRVVGSDFWRRSRRGADLVVWYEPLWTA